MSATAAKKDGDVYRIHQNVMHSAKVLKQAPVIGERLSAKRALTALSAPQKSKGGVAAGVYYTAPSGALWQGFTETGGAYYSPMMYVQAYSPFTFTNMVAESDKTSAKWNVAGYDVATIFPSFLDADNNFVYGEGLDPGYNIPMPQLILNADTFALGNFTTRPAYVLSQDTINGLAYANSCSESQLYSGGSLSTGYLYGTGGLSCTANGTKGTAWGVRQDYSAPSSPLYVEKFYAMVRSTSADPIPVGDTLTCYIADLAKGQWLYAIPITHNDVQVEEYNGKYYGTVFIERKVKTSIGEVSAPFTIDYPWRMQIEGFDDPNISLGFYGIEAADGESVKNANFLVQVSDVAVEDTANYHVGDSYAHYYSGCSLQLSISGMQDNVLAPDTYSNIEGCRSVTVQADGTTQELTNGAGLDGAIVLTAQNWLDGDGEENYYMNLGDENADSWVTACTADTLTLGDHLVNVVKFQCDELPAGVEGRTATVTFEGLGGVTSDPITIIQGVAPTGISSVEIDNQPSEKRNEIYNLQGQRVIAQTKGILIRNGRKYMRK